ncbi:MAG TPA: phosphoadenylyl-sulfate reductase [Actinomycetota bacterium]|nr:phosphoadenylyl-sulfate reductase [Actinomycetota bacterium]
MSPTPSARGRELIALLQRIVTQYRAPALASAFGAESMVLIDLIARHAFPIAVFTLDTGRLPQETYELMDRVRERYRLTIETYSPDAKSVEAFVRTHGVNAFYRGVELRERCCAIRKTAPLARALAGRDAWITGLRRAQSVTRSDLSVEAFDAEHGLAKFNPMVDWSEEEVWSYIRRHDVPTNPLHALGYPSIGCAPCTRAIEPGENIRAGRWWWERPEHKECGLHRRPIAIPVREERVGAAS